MTPKTVIIIFRNTFELHFYRLKTTGGYKKTVYPIAVGKLGDGTPKGGYVVLGKSRKPDWKIPPHEDYPETIWGTTIPFDDPQNPFQGGFIGIGNGLGIHGVRFDPKVGQRASHGCIRLRTSDLLKIYDKTSTGTPVIIY